MSPDASTIHEMLEGLDPKERMIALVASVIESHDHAGPQLLGLLNVLREMTARMSLADRSMIAMRMVEAARSLDDDVGGQRWN